MKIVAIAIILITSNLGNSNKNDCSDAHSSADDAYSYCKKAYVSDSWADSKNYLKKAMYSFEEAMSYSDECECDDANSSADEGYTYAKRGYNSSDWEETKRFAKKAMGSADDTMTNADDCNTN